MEKEKTDLRTEDVKTADLRFLWGTLQQKVRIKTFDGEKLVSTREEWRDIPLRFPHLDRDPEPDEYPDHTPKDRRDNKTLYRLIIIMIITHKKPPYELVRTPTESSFLIIGTFFSF